MIPQGASDALSPQPDHHSAISALLPLALHAIKRCVAVISHNKHEHYDTRPYHLLADAILVRHCVGASCARITRPAQRQERHHYGPAHAHSAALEKYPSFSIPNHPLRSYDTRSVSSTYSP
jgi:hypothetical protein